MFQPGQSGNPGGRPKGTARIRELVLARGDDLISELFAMAFAEDGDNRVKLEAIKILLDRGYGRPPQPITADDEGGPRRIIVSWLNEDGDPEPVPVHRKLL